MNAPGGHEVEPLARDVRAAEDQGRQTAEEQAALHRVATVVARAAPPEEVFAAVTEEAGRLLSSEAGLMSRYEIAHGLHPAVLAEGGLRPALRVLARRGGVLHQDNHAVEGAVVFALLAVAAVTQVAVSRFSSRRVVLAGLGLFLAALALIVAALAQAAMGLFLAGTVVGGMAVGKITRTM